MAAEIQERNSTGEIVATYLASAASAGASAGEKTARIDIVKPKRTGGVRTWVLGIFLPVGYPHSVTEDYMWYQIYDSLQAFSSSIAGLLSSRAVLQGVGVGDATASPTAALLLSVLQDSMGRMATILFAHKLGTALEPECKMYRLAADVFNDSAMMLDCVSPALPKTPRVLLLSFSSVLRALCGVAAGSSKASLSAHFAKWGNLGELNAKDSSQETVISLLGMLAGSLVVSQISSPYATWSCLILLLSTHLAMNTAAVRSVRLHTLNRQRVNIVFSEFLINRKVLTPKDVSARERIFEWDGVLRWRGGSPIGRAKVGVSLQDLLKPLAGAQTSTGALRGNDLVLSKLVDTFKNDGYLLWFQFPDRKAYIVLKGRATPQDQIKAWVHALWIAHRLKGCHEATGAAVDDVLIVLNDVYKEISAIWAECMERMKVAGWDMTVANIETTSGVRINLGTEDRRGQDEA